MMRTLAVSVLAVLAMVAMPSTAGAAPVIGGMVVTTGGEVKATFLGSTASYDSLLNLESPVFIDDIFHNHLTPVGTEVSLGVFPAGVELVFSIEVLNTGFKFFTGDASRNPDGIAHNIVDDLGGGVTLVGFEDLHLSEMPDYDYDDLSFSFTNTSIPEPATMSLLALGGLAALRRRAKA